MKRYGWFVVTSLAALVGCAETASAPVLPHCVESIATAITLAVGADTTIDPGTDSGCVSFPATGLNTSDVEYLVVAQSTGGIPGDSAPFGLRSATLVAGAPPAAVALRAARAARGVAAMRFDRMLHQQERLRRAFGGRVLRAPAWNGAVATVTPPTVGTLRTFTVCANSDCSVYKPVTGRVLSIGTHVAVYVDTLAPANGLDSAQVDSLRQVFDTHAYAVDTAAFGSVSDVDSNGVVIALMTPLVNALVSTAECQAAGFVAGFFDPADLDPATAAQHNDGEIFYTIVADPNGSLSCAHTVADVESFLPGTFLHELQHVISFNQHVLLRGGNLEDLWLDEALSSLAEELGGRSFLPDSTTFENYVFPDLDNAYTYLSDPGDHFLLQTSDTVIADFGAGWLYARYLVDQFGDSITNKLEQTTLTGTDNVAAQTGVPFTTTATRWALANWVSDLPGFAPSAGLFYRSWSLRQVFASFNAQDPVDFPQAFPLTPPVDGGGQVNIAGYLHGGSGSTSTSCKVPKAPHSPWTFEPGRARSRPRSCPASSSSGFAEPPGLSSALHLHPPLAFRRGSRCHIGSLSETPIPDIPERAMSPEALEVELEQLHPAAFGWAVACCGSDRLAAEDVLQASYLKVLDGRARFGGRASFRTWFFSVVRRTAAEHRRRNALWRIWPLSLLGPAADGRPDPGAAVVRAETTRRLLAALGRLPRRQREVLYLVFYQDLSIAEAADVAGISLGTARTHYERGKAALRKWLDGDHA